MAVSGQSQVPKRDSAERWWLPALLGGGCVYFRPRVRDLGGTQWPLLEMEVQKVCVTAHSSGSLHFLIMEAHI